MREINFFQNSIKYSIEIIQNLMIPEPDDAITTLLEPGRPRLIRTALFHVLTTVQFDDQLFVKADEVNDERSDRFLATELMAVDIAAAKLAPEFPFSFCLVRPQLTGQLFH